MCPDDALLSAFVDDEVPSPWKERMETHVAGCRRCSEKTVAFRALKRSLLAIDGEAEMKALSVAKSRIAASIDFGAMDRNPGTGVFERLGRLWTQRVPLPMPFLAASLLAIVFMIGVSLGLFTPFTNRAALMASASKTIAPQAATLEMIAQYMKQSSSVEPLMIEMPQESVFSQLGNPVVVSSPDPAIQEITTISYEGSTR
ncbi:MAG TPA: zf-HC2 domain-containing protein [Rectinemataceae bacterium]|nr:zf-HC2 domain-containing protein [Rectinemataceae bacterium]